MDILESGEMYLETIYRLKSGGGPVRSIDVARAFDKAKSSVSRAINILKDRGYIRVDVNGDIDFTDEGRGRAEEIFERHALLSEWLVSLGVSRETAEADACRMEHIISRETFEAIKNNMD